MLNLYVWNCDSDIFESTAETCLCPLQEPPLGNRSHWHVFICHCCRTLTVVFSLLHFVFEVFQMAEAGGWRSLSSLLLTADHLTVRGSLCNTEDCSCSYLSSFRQLWCELAYIWIEFWGSRFFSLHFNRRKLELWSGNLIFKKIFTSKVLTLTLCHKSIMHTNQILYLDWYAFSVYQPYSS